MQNFLEPPHLYIPVFFDVRRLSNSEKSSLIVPFKLLKRSKAPEWTQGQKLSTSWLHVPCPFWGTLRARGPLGSGSLGAGTERGLPVCRVGCSPACSSHHPPETEGGAEGGEATVELGHGLQEVPGVLEGSLPGPGLPLEIWCQRPVSPQSGCGWGRGPRLPNREAPCPGGRGVSGGAQGAPGTQEEGGLAHQRRLQAWRQRLLPRRPLPSRHRGQAAAGPPRNLSSWSWSVCWLRGERPTGPQRKLAWHL